MKNIFKKFTFWFFILSVVIILNNLKGYDDMDILLICFNPILNSAVYKEPFRSIIWSNGPNLNMYIAHLFTYTMYGLFIDCIVIIIKKLSKYSF